MAGSQKLILVGTLGSDVKVKTLPSGPLGNLKVFVKESWKTQSGERGERVQIFHCNIWGPRVFSLEHLLKRGSKVYIEGKVIQREGVNRETGAEDKYFVVDVDSIIVTHVKIDGEYQDTEEEKIA